jgi:hypothetical protein
MMRSSTSRGSMRPSSPRPCRRWRTTRRSITRCRSLFSCTCAIWREFFHEGTAEFRSSSAGALGPLPRGNDNVHAVDFCCKILWDEKRFDPNTKLRRALNKTLSHLTYSRDVGSGLSEIDVAYDGPSHTHGTVILVRRIWDAFVDSLRAEYRTELADWLEKQATGLKLSISGFDDQFDKWARRWGWRLNETPDGHI